VCVCVCVSRVGSAQSCWHAVLMCTYVFAHDARYANIEGGQVMEEMSQLANGISIAKLEQDEMEGVDEDEWGEDDDGDD
jgi:hypothetical protein